MSGTTSTDLPSFSHDQHHKTDVAKRKGGGREGEHSQLKQLYIYSWNFVQLQNIDRYMPVYDSRKRGGCARMRRQTGVCFVLERFLDYSVISNKRSKQRQKWFRWRRSINPASVWWCGRGRGDDDAASWAVCLSVSVSTVVSHWTNAVSMCYIAQRTDDDAQLLLLL